MDTDSIAPGTVLADRYVIEDQLEEDGESESFRAHDKILARSVVVHVLSSASPLAAGMLDAAKRASRVTDPRILQVLDAVDDGEHSYVVREWVTGRSLDVVLGEGPLPAHRAASLIAEVAAAISSAHRAGLAHQRLSPDAVVLTASSGVKVIGLGTFAALRSATFEVDDPEAADARDLGRLLYACLTARWPGGDWGDLAAAPTEHGRLLRPRQVRAGVPRSLDMLCDRILGDPPRAGRPVTTVDEVRSSLSTILTNNGFTEASAPQLMAPVVAEVGPAAPPPALLALDNDGPVTGEQAAITLPGQGGDSRTRRTLLLAAVAVLVVGGLLLAYLVGRHGLGQTPPAEAKTGVQHRTPPATTTQAPATHPLPISSATAFDPPPGNGVENSGEADLAIDASKQTAWTTMTYYNYPNFGRLKPGVGLILDLGRQQEVTTVTLRLVGEPTGVQVRAAPASAAQPPDTTAGFRLAATRPRAGTVTSIALAKPVTTRFVLVWLTSLPSEGGNAYRGGIADVTIRG